MLKLISKFVFSHFCLQKQQLDQDEFKFRSGPVTAALDKTLNKHGIKRQAYHGKAFNGNHVKKGCQVIMRILQHY